MKKAWDSHPLCKRCKKTRTKSGLCAKCAAETRKKKKKKPKAKEPTLTRAQEKAYVEAAQRQHHEEGTCEIDDGAKVSWSPEGGGAYVQSWVWVYDED